MSELVADCPRCGASKITFGVMANTYVKITRSIRSPVVEAFCICRNCQNATIFLLRIKDAHQFLPSVSADTLLLSKVIGGINELVDTMGYISIKNMAAQAPPEHLPSEINAAFKEGATCLSVQCANAAAAMFRLCLDMATKNQLPVQDENGLNAKIRRSLGLRIEWLLKNTNSLEGLAELADCIKEDGNDGAHDGTLSMNDAQDLLDFTVALLQRLYTDPAKLSLAKEKRNARRASSA